jgi:hypothetical protein
MVIINNTKVIWKSIVNDYAIIWGKKVVPIIYFMLLPVQSPGDTEENNRKSQLSKTHIVARFQPTIF